MRRLVECAFLTGVGAALPTVWSVMPNWYALGMTGLWGFGVLLEAALVVW